MARVNHKLVKQRLNEKRSKITDKQFFSSRMLAGHFEDLAAAQTRRYHYNRRVRVNLYWKPKDAFTAATDNMQIRINTGHPLVTKVKGRENRYQLVCGMFAHELGHVLFTDFLSAQTYHNYLDSFKWYPRPPAFRLAADARNEKAFWEYVKEDPKNLQMVHQIAANIANIIEDGYIENRMLNSFPGTLGYGLETLRERHFDEIDTVTELIAKETDDGRHKNIMAEITLCSLMGRTTSFARQLVAAVEEVMAPYSAEASEEYMEFADMTEELKSDYAKSIDCLKLPNGKIVECGSYPYFSKYSIVDGKVSQNKVGPLHHTRRTKQSRKIQYLPNCPRQKLYKTFEKYAGDYRGYEYNEEEKGYGFYCNPNAMWDWYQIGGRWPVSFLVKTDCTEYSFGERSWGNYSKKYPAPEGYMWVSAARKKDICWDVMQNWYTVQDTERYNKFKEAFQTGKLPDGYYGKIQENGIFYCGECTYAADETLDEYLARVGIPKSWKYPIGVSDIVDADEWLSKNDINIGKESNSWHEQIDTYIDDLDGEDVLVSVDYHI